MTNKNEFLKNIDYIENLITDARIAIDMVEENLFDLKEKIRNLINDRCNNKI